MLRQDYDKKSLKANSLPNGAPADTDNQAVVTARAGNEPLRFVAPTHGGVDILKLLTELEDLIENTPKMMGALLRFDEDKFHMTVMKIRANLPEEMKRASKLARDTERIVEETRENAERIIADARQAAQQDFERSKTEAARLREQAQAEIVHEREALEREAQHQQQEMQRTAEQMLTEARSQAAQITADSEIVRMAEAMAQDLKARAEAEATAVRKGADDYARDVLANLEGVLGNAVTQIQRGRDMLERTR